METAMRTVILAGLTMAAITGGSPARAVAETVTQTVEINYAYDGVQGGIANVDKLVPNLAPTLPGILTDARVVFDFTASVDQIARFFGPPPESALFFIQGPFLIDAMGPGAFQTAFLAELSVAFGSLPIQVSMEGRDYIGEISGTREITGGGSLLTAAANPLVTTFDLAFGDLFTPFIAGATDVAGPIRDYTEVAGIVSITYDFTLPEPASYALVIIGLTALLPTGRRFKPVR